METFLPDDAVHPLIARLRAAQETFARHYPGEPATRQPVHTVYVGAHAFDAGTAQSLGMQALFALTQSAPRPEVLAEALGIVPALAGKVYERVVAKLRREPVEDLR